MVTYAYGSGHMTVLVRTVVLNLMYRIRSQYRILVVMCIKLGIILEWFMMTDYTEVCKCMIEDSYTWWVSLGWVWISQIDSYGVDTLFITCTGAVMSIESTEYYYDVVLDK